MNAKRYAIFMDLDRTLMCGNVVPQVNIDTIQQVRAQGHYVFVNTARSFAYMPEHIRSCNYLDGFVAGIGTDLRFHGKQIFSHSVPAEDSAKIVDHFITGQWEICLEGEDIVLWINPKRPSAIGGITLSSADDFMKNYKERKISKFYIGGALTNKERQWLEKDYLIFSHPNYTEFVSKGYGKGNGLERMMKYLGLPMENSIAMGDSVNDIHMLKASGISVAMGNAAPEIKEMCDYVSCDAKDGGVAMALKKLIPLE